MERLDTEIQQLQQRPGALSEVDVWRKRLDALLLLSEASCDSLFTDDVFQKLADTLLEITGFDSMSVLLHDPQARCYRMAVSRGLSPEEAAQLKVLPADRGDFLTIAAQTRQPVFTSNHAADPRAAEDKINEAGLKGIVFVPLLAGDRYLGVYILSSKEAVEWDEGQVRWLASIGQQIGVICRHTQLGQDLQIAAAQRERLRLGREMHDGWAQSLGYLNLQATITNSLLSEGKVDEAQSSLNRMKELTATMYDQVTAEILSLRSILLPGGFLASLRTYLADYRAQCGIEARLVVDDEPLIRFSPDAELQLLRIIQEALSNVHRHAGADKAWVFVEPEGDGARIVVADDGRGFDPVWVASSNQQGFGLQIMRERAESVGGSLELDAQRGRGTRVLVWMPGGE